MIQQAAARMRTVRDLLWLLGSSRRWWLIPFVVVLLSSVLILAGLQAVEYVAPFVYSIF